MGKVFGTNDILNAIYDSEHKNVKVGGITVDSLTATDVGLVGALAESLATNAEIKALQAKVDTLNAKLDGVIDGTTPAKTQLTGSFVRESTEPFPQGVEGNDLLLWDTGQVFVHDGTEWREL